MRRIWRSRRWPAWALLPLSALYALLSGAQRWLYRLGIKRSTHAGLPTIVIGNVIAGGAGKTPVTLATVRHLQAQGWQPGIVSRGYGRSSQACQLVTAQSLPQEVGDEPLLLFQACGAPVAVAPQRAQAAQALLSAHPEVNVLLCDDGLQHLALARDIEICVFNDEGIGNGWLLPAGPLREPWPRPIDIALHTAAPPPALAHLPHFQVRRTLATQAYTAAAQALDLASLASRPIYALAAIARPEEFFTMLRQHGVHLKACLALPDHHPIHNYDFSAHLDWPPPDAEQQTEGHEHPVILCTEKDAAKLRMVYPQALAVPLRIEIDPAYFACLDAKLAPWGTLRTSPTSPPG